MKIETLAQALSCEIWEISQNTFLTEHVWATASDFTETSQLICIVNQLIYSLLQLLKELYKNIHYPTKIFEDNTD